MLKIWGRRNSLNVQKVMWLVGELGLEHEHVPAGGSFGRLDEPGFARLNPNRLIPVIEDGDLAVWESHAILRYLAARYGAETFWPPDSASRSMADRWLDWMLGTLQPAFFTIFGGFYRTAEAQRQWPAIRRGMSRCAALYGLLDRELSTRDYLAGPAISLADIAVGTSLYRYYGMGIETPSLPNVESWYARLRERPAYREHVMIAFDDMRG